MKQILNASASCVAAEEFDRLLFEFGLELDEDVSLCDAAFLHGG